MNDCMTQGDAMNMNNEQAVSILIPLRDMMRDQYGCPISDAYFALDKAIKALTSVQPDHEWIPCSERLPEEPRHYLCSFNRPNRIDKIYVDLAYWTGGRWYGYMSDQINAWMPLPEPFKEGEQE